MTTTSRIMPTELSRKQINKQTVQAEYKAGYGFFIVTSRFAGNEQLVDLFYEITQKKRGDADREQHGDLHVCAHDE